MTLQTGNLRRAVTAVWQARRWRPATRLSVPDGTGRPCGRPRALERTRDDADQSSTIVDKDYDMAQAAASSPT